MIPTLTQRSVETSPVTASASFGISQNDVAHILTMLRDTLYSDPRNRSGGRLATFLGLSDEEYLARFDRANLCRGVWSDRVAKATARRLAASPRPAYVLLGEKVCAAFDVEYEPFTVDERPDGATFAVLPHPSGINRIWCRSENVKLARVTVETAIRI